MLNDLYKYQYNTEDLFLTPTRKIYESKIQVDLVPGVEINKKVKYSQELMVKAIQYGMIM